MPGIWFLGLLGAHSAVMVLAWNIGCAGAALILSPMGSGNLILVNYF
ncbi:hypothetical protein TheveDRAFT_0360 [Thermanaerovibrio velox DSM 12556]|uniref:Uncharacterized protein n=1 Tax=Thermanaerovibrio velox DSM 12556 TaxID=926567 RepID=H0UPB6_9BACT|nr:hypothetical protein TheveDRAFT_0360 [Thermanaerovibrio velox DSM 12556]